MSKKLLILGATYTEIEIINAAKRMNLYVIVTDNHTDWSLAPAKYLADEAWNISWSDIETLKQQCMSNGVNGVMAGFSEKRVICAQKLCEQLNLPFYAERSDLDIITDKIKFKHACIKSGVKIPKEYNIGENVKFPVIVKPVDNGGGRGISVCENTRDLQIAYELAMSCSDSKEVVIEDYIVADETMSYFVVSDRQIYLSAMCDRYMYYFGDGMAQLPIGYMYPSSHLELLLKEENIQPFKSLISNLNIDNGLIAFQSFVRGSDIIPFDPTYRLDGTMTYHITETINNVNVLSMLINYSMTGSMSCEVLKENPKFSTHAFQLPILLTKGTLAKIEGVEEVKSMKNVIHFYVAKFEGDVMTKVADFSQIFGRVHILVNSYEELVSDIETIYNLLDIRDEKNDDMIIRIVKDTLYAKIRNYFKKS